MASKNIQHYRFIQRTVNLSSKGFDIFRQMEALANDAVDLGFLSTDALTQEDVSDVLVGLDVSDVSVAIQGISELGALLDANNGSLRKAFKRLAQFSTL